MNINRTIGVFCAITIVLLAACPNGTTNDAPPPAFTVTFDPNFGNWSGDSDNMTIQVNSGTAVAAPIPAPSRSFSSFEGWYTEPIGGERYNFATPVTGRITLFARWSITFFFTSIDEVTTYLGWQPTNAENSPLFLPIIINLETMTQANSGWQNLLDVIETAGRFVALDLSACTMDGTVFNPVSSIATGKDKIVFIALPDTAKSIPDGTSSATASFRNFTNLRSFRGKGLSSIGNFAFYMLTSFNQITFLDGLTSIGNYAFYGCTSLGQITLPEWGLISIGNLAFAECKSLLRVFCRAPIPSVTLGTTIFAGNSLGWQIKVPVGSAAAYRGTAGWNSFNQRIHSIECNGSCGGTCQ
ncbi:MAG: leucine-rich repeat protein [Treponema sp.]|nr:leucine-rich repeat protein [Treponema sp.]